MAERTIRCRLITPQKRVLDAEVSQAVVPLHDGQMGFLNRRSAIVGRLGYGELRLEFPDGSRKSWFIDGGFVQNVDNTVTILAEGALEREKLDIEEAKAELAEAIARKPQDAGEMKRITEDRTRARAKVAMARSSR